MSDNNLSLLELLELLSNRIASCGRQGALWSDVKCDLNLSSFQSKCFSKKLYSLGFKFFVLEENSRIQTLEVRGVETVLQHIQNEEDNTHSGNVLRVVASTNLIWKSLGIHSKYELPISPSLDALELIGSTGEKGILATDLSNEMKLKAIHHIIDKVVGPGLVVKRMVRKAPKLEKKGNPNLRINILHLKKFGYSFDANKYGYITDADDSIKENIIEVIYKILETRGISEMKCSDVRKILNINQYTMDIFRLQFLAQKSTTHKIIFFESAIDSISTWFIGRQDISSPSETSITKKLGSECLFTLPIFHQAMRLVNIQTDGKGISSNIISSSLGLSKKSSARITFELTNTYGLPFVKVMEGRQQTYKLFPRVDTGATTTKTEESHVDSHDVDYTPPVSLESVTQIDCDSAVVAGVAVDLDVSQSGDKGLLITGNMEVSSGVSKSDVSVVGQKGSGVISSGRGPRAEVLEPALDAVVRIPSVAALAPPPVPVRPSRKKQRVFRDLVDSERVVASQEEGHPDQSETRRLENTVGGSVTKITEARLRTMLRLLQEHEGVASVRDCLMSIRSEESNNASLVDRKSIYRLIEKLEKQGLVVRVTAAMPSDYQLTTSGLLSIFVAVVPLEQISDYIDQYARGGISSKKGTSSSTATQRPSWDETDISNRVKAFVAKIYLKRHVAKQLAKEKDRQRQRHRLKVIQSVAMFGFAESGSVGDGNDARDNLGELLDKGTSNGDNDDSEQEDSDEPGDAMQEDANDDKHTLFEDSVGDHYSLDDDGANPTADQSSTHTAVMDSSTRKPPPARYGGRARGTVFVKHLDKKLNCASDMQLLKLLVLIRPYGLCLGSRDVHWGLCQLCLNLQSVRKPKIVGPPTSNTSFVSLSNLIEIIPLRTLFKVCGLPSMLERRIINNIVWDGRELNASSRESEGLTDEDKKFLMFFQNYHINFKSIFELSTDWIDVPIVNELRIFFFDSLRLHFSLLISLGILQPQVGWSGRSPFEFFDGNYDDLNIEEFDRVQHRKKELIKEAQAIRSRFANIVTGEIDIEEIDNLDWDHMEMSWKPPGSKSLVWSEGDVIFYWNNIVINELRKQDPAISRAITNKNKRKIADDDISDSEDDGVSSDSESSDIIKKSSKKEGKLTTSGEEKNENDVEKLIENIESAESHPLVASLASVFENKLCRDDFLVVRCSRDQQTKLKRLIRQELSFKEEDEQGRNNAFAEKVFRDIEDLFDEGGDGINDIRTTTASSGTEPLVGEDPPSLTTGWSSKEDCDLLGMFLERCLMRIGCAVYQSTRTPPQLDDSDLQYLSYTPLLNYDLNLLDLNFNSAIRFEHFFKGKWKSRYVVARRRLRLLLSIYKTARRILGFIIASGALEEVFVEYPKLRMGIQIYLLSNIPGNSHTNIDTDVEHRMSRLRRLQFVAFTRVLQTYALPSYELRRQGLLDLTEYPFNFVMRAHKELIQNGWLSKRIHRPKSEVRSKIPLGFEFTSSMWSELKEPLAKSFQLILNPDNNKLQIKDAITTRGHSDAESVLAAVVPFADKNGEGWIEDQNYHAIALYISHGICWDRVLAHVVIQSDDGGSKDRSKEEASDDLYVATSGLGSPPVDESVLPEPTEYVNDDYIQKPTSDETMGRLMDNDACDGNTERQVTISVLPGLQDTPTDALVCPLMSQDGHVRRLGCRIRGSLVVCYREGDLAEWPDVVIDPACEDGAEGNDLDGMESESDLEMQTEPSKDVHALADEGTETSYKKLNGGSDLPAVHRTADGFVDLREMRHGFEINDTIESDLGAVSVLSTEDPIPIKPKRKKRKLPEETVTHTHLKVVSSQANQDQDEELNDAAKINSMTLQVLRETDVSGIYIQNLLEVLNRKLNDEIVKFPGGSAQNGEAKDHNITFPYLSCILQDLVHKQEISILDKFLNPYDNIRNTSSQALDLDPSSHLIVLRKYAKLYGFEEESCLLPWMDAKGNKNELMYETLKLKVIVILTANPGAELPIICASLHLLSPCQTDLLLKVLEKEGIVRSVAVPNFIDCRDPLTLAFTSAIMDLPSDLGCITCYFLNKLR